jgi:hypothetical protein
MLRRTVVLLLAILLLAPAVLALDSAPLQLEVVLSERALYVYRGAKQVKKYRVAIGTIDHPTPEGSYTIEELIWNPGWVPLADREWTRNATKKEPLDSDNPMRVLKMPFDAPYYFIHGTPDGSSVGRLASHGCIRMTERDVEELGRLVMDETATPLDEAWLVQLKSEGKSGTVRLNTPISLAIRMGKKNVYPGVVWALDEKAATPKR